MIQVFSYSSVGFSGEANYAAWKESVKSIFDIDPEGRADVADFRAEVTSYFLGSIVLGHTKASAQNFVRNADTIARTGVDHILIQLYTCGGYTGMAGAHPIDVSAGDICVLDCAEVVNTLATDFECLTVIVPRAMLEAHFSTPDALHGLVLRPTSGANQILARHFQALLECAPGMNEQDCKSVTQGTVALIVACLQGELDARGERTGAGNASLLIRIRRHIDDNLASADLNADAIADVFAMSRASLYRLFKPLGGVSEYIRSRRLRRIFFELRSAGRNGRRTGEIGLRWGFSNESSFNRAFKAAYGISPASLREMAVFETDRNEDGSDETFPVTQWINDILGDRAD
jgi:AraC-like DNA-binding protein